MLAMLRTFSWQDLRHHPWRSAAAMAAVMLGVALAFAVHVINASALDEFSQAVRAVNGQPDLEVRPMQGTLAESLFAQVATHPDVARANPVLEATAMARPAEQAPGTAPTALRLLGADALLLPAMAPALMPKPWEGAARDALFAPATVYLNPAALQALGVPPEGSQPRPTLQLQTGLQTLAVQVAGTVSAPGTPLAVIGMNLELLDQPGRAPSPHALQRIRRSALGMQQMTETLLWLSRESGELRDDGHIEVGRLLEELLEEQQALSQRRGLTFHLDVEPHSLPQTRARIIIGNLLRNALQYSDEGVVEIVVRDRSLLISNPIGAAQGTDESMAFGYGLGLDLVQRLCQKSGWRLHYSSDEQRFRCELLFPSTPD